MANVQDTGKVDFNDKRIKDLIRTFKGKMPTVRVGILASKDSRNSQGQGGLTNTQVGMFHEFGTSKVPRRSFLRMPLSTQLKPALDAAGIFDRKALDQVAQTKSLSPWLERIGIVAESVVLEAFHSGGYGEWVPWKTGYMNHAGMILVDSTQLRDSIGSEVVE
jgi:phage gpG-like protein